MSLSKITKLTFVLRDLSFQTTARVQKYPVFSTLLSPVEEMLTVLLVAILAGLESPRKMHTLHYLGEKKCTTFFILALTRTLLVQDHLASCLGCIYTEPPDSFASALQLSL